MIQYQELMIKQNIEKGTFMISIAKVTLKKADVHVTNKIFSILLWCLSLTSLTCIGMKIDAKTILCLKP